MPGPETPEPVVVPGVIRLELWKRLLFSAIVLVVSLVVAWFVYRRFAPVVPLIPPPNYDDIIAESLVSPERLFKAGSKATYDVRGLYEGAAEATLRVSEKRFIEPEPTFEARYRVLFLGGSTTEAIYVPESQRWVALLNEPGYLAAYNAGMSGANTVDEFFTFRYLAHEKGMKFDLVVLTTRANDFGWQKRLMEGGGRLRIVGYQDALRKWHQLQQRRKHEATRSVDLGIRMDENDGSVARRYRVELEKLKGKPRLSAEMCPEYQAALQAYRENAVANLAALRFEVASTGAKLLVLSEAASYGAPASSFPLDLRIPIEYPEGKFSLADMILFTDETNRWYLESAREVGALTHDLAGEIGPLVNGPEGGTYMYDSMHYTPRGCREVARILRPVLRRILEDNE